MADLLVNGRFTVHQISGTERYAHELCSRFGERVRLISPESRLTGLKGHLWEQTSLALAARKTLLWSPVNTGPLAVSRQIITIHDLITLDHPEWFTGAFAGWYKLLLPVLAKRVSHIIAVSDFTRQRILELLRVPETKVTVVSNGVGPQFQPRDCNQVETVKRRLKIPTENYIVYIGSLEPRKNLGRLLEAWARVADDLPASFSLVVAGAKGNSRVFPSGAETSSTQMSSARVRFVGYVPDEELPALYSGAHALVYPSLYEGFGLPPLEAMACATPALVANTTCMPELVTHPELRFEPDNPDSIGDSLRRAVLTPGWREKWSAVAKADASKYNWDYSAAATWEVLERFL